MFNLDDLNYFNYLVISIIIISHYVLYIFLYFYNILYIYYI